MLRSLLLIVCVSYALAVICYDCYDTGPDHKACTRERNCTGLACMIFNAGNNATSTAFCLLAMRGNENIDQKTGCWLEPDGRGRHCMCHTNFCNQLLPQSEQSRKNPMIPLLPNAEFLKQNPLIDYHDHLEESSEHNGAAPAPENVLFPAAAMTDPKTAGGSDDDDLVPVDFADYDRELSEKETKTATATSAHPPALVLMSMTLATSWARLFAYI